ncbi:Membrane-anchored ubiquitin-fold protein 3 [Glycine soja]|nr:Membrane-anchored ubiquitin-fold protein 3 [Glycine soja]
MAEGEGCIELKFRIYDGTDIAHSKTVTPKSVSDLKLIHAGKVLENNKTLADYRITFGEIPGGVVTMHVVVQPPVTKKKQSLSKQNWLKKA